MKPWQKIAVTVVLSLAVFSVVIILGLIAFLPDPAKLGLYRRPRVAVAKTTAPTPAPVMNDPMTTTPVVAAAQGLTNTPAANASPTPALDTAARKKLVSEKFIDRYMTDDRIQSRVCDNLANASTPFRSAEEFGGQVEKSLLGEAPTSAAAEAVMLPIEYTLKNEAVRDLVDSATNAAERGDTGFVQKAQFYAQAARATASVLSSRDELEAISADAYQLYALSRAVTLKPELLQDPDMTDLCRGIERSAIDGVDRDQNFDRDRMARLLARHGIDNESIGYDPRMSTRLSIVTTDGGMQIKMPWLDAVFQTSAKAAR